MSTTDQIREIIIQDHLWQDTRDALTDDLPLIENHVVDSLGLLRLVARIEDDFGIEVRDEDMVMSNFGSIGRISAFIEGRRTTT